MIQVMSRNMGRAIGDAGIPGLRLVQQVVGLANTLPGGRVGARAVRAGGAR